MKKFKVVFFRKEDGSEPAKDFILSVDKKMQAKIYRNIDLLMHNGPFVREPYSKFLEDGIFELRMQVASNISRILYFFVFGNRIVLANGFIKKTQKTPTSEIEKAKRYRNEFLDREGNKL